MSKQKPEVGDKFTRVAIPDGTIFVVTAVGDSEFLARREGREAETMLHIGETMLHIGDWGSRHNWIDPNPVRAVADQWGYLNRDGTFLPYSSEDDARAAASWDDKNRTLARIIRGVVHVESYPSTVPFWVPAPVRGPQS